MGFKAAGKGRRYETSGVGVYNQRYVIRVSQKMSARVRMYRVIPLAGIETKCHMSATCLSVRKTGLLQRGFFRSQRGYQRYHKLCLRAASRSHVLEETTAAQLRRRQSYLVHLRLSWIACSA